MHIAPKRAALSLLVAGLLALSASAVPSRNPTVANTVHASPGATTTEQTILASPMMVKISGMPGAGIRDTTAAAFDNADWDRDGRLNRKEAKAMPRIARHFHLIDSNNDGFISMAEDQTYVHNYRSPVKK